MCVIEPTYGSLNMTYLFFDKGFIMYKILRQTHRTDITTSVLYVCSILT